MSVKPIKPKDIKPISPDEALALKAEDFPDEVISSFNALIAKHFKDGEAVVMQNEAVNAIYAAFKASGKNITKQGIFDKNYLDVEEVYQKQGWTVDFDQPAYCETYEAFFVFRKKRNQNDCE